MRVIEDHRVLAAPVLGHQLGRYKDVIRSFFLVIYAVFFLVIFFGDRLLTGHDGRVSESAGRGLGR